jgi:hypothetical protein
VRGFLRSRRNTPAPQAKPDELEEQRRVQEVQEQIRRRIAERRGARPESTPPPLRTDATRPTRSAGPETTQMPQPFGGPLRRVLEEVRREPAPAPAATVAATEERRNYELERQQQLANELRSIEESRVIAVRRAAHVAADKAAEARTEGALRTAARGRVIDDLRNPESLRRAFVLREVLGTPVGLR